MPVKTRWECSNCQEICEKRPFYNIYHKGTGKLLRGSKTMVNPPEGYEARCTNCGCLSKYHSFTFKEPKKKENE